MKRRSLAQVAASLVALTGVCLVPAFSGSRFAPLPGQEKEQKHPIDKQLDACMDKNGSTAGMVQCIDAALKAWDKEMNKHYQTVMGRLDAKGKAALKASQVAWLAYRDREYKAIIAVYGRMDGTMYVPMRADSAMQVTKDRALLLERYAGLEGDEGR